MRLNIVGAFIRNSPFGTEIAFKKGFDRLGGHQVTTIDTSYPDQKWDHDADATIVFKWMEGYWEDLIRCGGKKIVYQPDDIRFPHIRDMMQKMRVYCDYALTFDDEAAKIAQDELGYKDARKLLLTADDELYRPEERGRDIDISFIGSLTGGPNHDSRLRMAKLVQREYGSRFVVASNLYNMQLIREVYKRSKIVLNHATDVGQPFGSGYGLQCRHFEVGMTGTCLLSNSIIGHRDLSSFMTFSSEESLMTNLDYLLKNEDVRNSFGDGLLREIRESHLPQHRAAEMIEFIRSLP